MLSLSLNTAGCIVLSGKNTLDVIYGLDPAVLSSLRLVAQADLRAHVLQPGRAHGVAGRVPLAAAGRSHGPRPEAVCILFFEPGPRLRNGRMVLLVADAADAAGLEGEGGALEVERGEVLPLRPEPREAGRVRAAADDHDVDEVQVRPSRGWRVAGRALRHELLDSIRRPREASAAGRAHEVDGDGVLAHRTLPPEAGQEAPEALDIVAPGALMVDLDANVVLPRDLARPLTRLLGVLRALQPVEARERNSSDRKEDLAVAILRAVAEQVRVLGKRVRDAVPGAKQLGRVHEGQRDGVARAFRRGQPVRHLAPSEIGHLVAVDHL